MHEIDKFLVNWCKRNGYDSSGVIDLCGWPSEESFEPYFEELAHILDDGEEELGFSLPDEIIAYRLSKWSGTNVPIDHQLVVRHKEFFKIYLDSEYDMAKPVDVKRLWLLVRGIAGPELLSNLGDFGEVEQYLDSPDISGQLVIIQVNGVVYYVAISEDAVAFMNPDGVIKVFDYDGDRIYRDQDLPKIRNYIIGGTRLAPQIEESSALAALIGNELARLVLGEDGISILELPD